MTGAGQGAKKPTADDMELAAQWLDANEGDNGEAETCAKVAEWLRSQAADIELRRAARKAGVPMKMVRAALSPASGGV